MKKVLPFVTYRLRVLPGELLIAVLISLYRMTAKPFYWKTVRLIHEPGQQNRTKDIVEALELIQSVDVRRIKLIQKHIKCIVLFRWNLIGVYYVTGKICGIRPLRASIQKADALKSAYASVIVHEATHGRLERMRFAYSKKNKTRIEQICWTEQGRFLRRTPAVASSALLILQENRDLDKKD